MGRESSPKDTTNPTMKQDSKAQRQIKETNIQEKERQKKEKETKEEKERKEKRK